MPATKPRPKPKARRSLQAERFRAFQRAVRMHHVEMAKLLACSRRTIQDWSRDAVKAPPAIMEWLEACIEHRRAHPDPPPPAVWRRTIKWEERPKSKQPLRWRATTTMRHIPNPPKRPVFAEILAARFGEDLTAEELMKRLVREKRRSPP